MGALFVAGCWRWRSPWRSRPRPRRRPTPTSRSSSRPARRCRRWSSCAQPARTGTPYRAAVSPRR
ncbi:hypothetical protein VP06_01580 [Methylobacterium aquaticum]|uniref:Uncharacterized protein n=1 Tax=Methylobacterium aquaticum TaxID=270351 RepID=A0A0J6T0K8_9HYPH|nr:hypothetical protein VP06_01580 [Methylobacterium aquaticum]